LKKLDAEGIPHETLLNQFKAGIAWQKLIGHLVAASELSDEEITEHTKLKQSQDVARYWLAEIAIPYQSYFDAPEAESKALEVINLLKEGYRFGQLAQQFSQNPSAIRGGDIDWIDETQIEKPLLEQIEKTPVGAVTQPIRHNGSVYIILVRGKQKPNALRQKLSVRQIEVSFPLLMSQDQKEAEIAKLEEIMRNVKTCESFEKIADTIEGATLQYHQNITPEQLSGGLDKIIEQLEVGIVSPALPIQDRSVMFFMVCEKHKVDKNKDFEEQKKLMKQQLEQKKFMELSAKRLNMVRRRAFIDIRL
jgi:peptidyl-prolyl cis-trans isomerase SurA